MKLGRPTGRLLVVDPSVALDEPDVTPVDDRDAPPEPVSTTPQPAAAAARGEGAAAG
jgi:hypothetical protein